MYLHVCKPHHAKEKPTWAQPAPWHGHGLLGPSLEIYEGQWGGFSEKTCHDAGICQINLNTFIIPHRALLINCPPRHSWQFRLLWNMHIIMCPVPIILLAMIWPPPLLPSFPVSSGHEGCLRILLEQKPSSNQEGNLFTPLHCALWVLLQHHWMPVTANPARGSYWCDHCVFVHSVNGHGAAAALLLKTVGSRIVNLGDAKGR